MARVTVEDCLNHVGNRFALIHMSAKRVRQLRKGAEPMVVCKNKDIVTSLREIADGAIFQTETKQRSRPPKLLEDAQQIVSQTDPSEQEMQAEG